MVIFHRKILFNFITATLFAIATIPGTAIGGVIADKWGKRLTMFTSNLLAYGFWLITAFANNKNILFFSYSLQGFFGIIALNLVGEHKLPYCHGENNTYATDLCRYLYCRDHRSITKAHTESISHYIPMPWISYWLYNYCFSSLAYV